jgi:hypothetical protein
MRLCALVAAVLSVAAPVNVAAAEIPLVADFDSRLVLDEGREYDALRMDLDLTGDDEPELVLGIQGRVSWWFVYQKVSEGKYRFLGDLEFNEVMFRTDRDPLRIVMLFATGGRSKTIIKRFDGTTFIDCLPLESAACADSGEDFGVWRKRVGLQVLWAKLPELGKPSPEWRDLLSPGVTPKARGLLEFSVIK